MEIFKCEFCGREFGTKNACNSHRGKCKQNPNYVFKPKSEKWLEVMHKRKGSSGTNQFIYAKEHGLPIPKGTMKGKPGTWLGRKHTDEEKKKISESMKKVYEGKSIWKTQIEKRKSFAEQYFDTCFPNLKQNYHVDRYFLDLANPKKKLYIEIDGEQHYNNPKVVEHDKIRTSRLEELGWICLARIRWSKYKKLSKEEQEYLIAELQSQINTGY